LYLNKKNRCRYIAYRQLKWQVDNYEVKSNNPINKRSFFRIRNQFLQLIKALIPLKYQINPRKDSIIQKTYKAIKVFIFILIFVYNYQHINITFI